MYPNSSRYNHNTTMHNNNMIMHNRNIIICNHSINPHSITRYVNTMHRKEIEVDTEM
jgi:hypothetical protein